MNDRAPGIGSLSRRQVLTGATATLGAAWMSTLLAGCAPTAGAAGVQQLAFWHLLTGGDGIRMGDMVTTANKDDQGFDATQTILAWGAPYYTKLATASAGGRAPDLAVMHASRIPGYAPGGLLDPWDMNLLAEVGLKESDFVGAIWKKGGSGGKQYAVPLDAHPFVMFVNTAIAKKAGLTAQQMSAYTNPNQLIQAAQKMTKVTGKPSVSFGYLNDASQLWRMFYGLYRQTGATMTLPQGGKVKYDEAAAVKTIDYIKQLLDGKIGKADNDYPSALAEFLGGNTGLYFTGVWEVPSAEGVKLPFDVVPIPTLFGHPAAYADSHTLVLPHQSNPDPKKRHDTYKLVADLIKDSLVWSKGGHIPAYTPVTQSAAYKAEVPQAHYAPVASYVNYDPPAWFVGAGGQFQTLFCSALQPSLLSGQDPRVGLKQFEDSVNQLLAKPNPV